MGVLVDTGVLIDAERGRVDLGEVLSGQTAAISVITVSELLHGVHRTTGASRVHRHAFIEYVLEALAPLPITEQIARVHAEIWARLRRRGEPIGLHDLWIGATALAHGFSVATQDVADFRRVPGLRVIDATPDN